MGRYVEGERLVSREESRNKLSNEKRSGSVEALNEYERLRLGTVFWRG